MFIVQQAEEIIQNIFSFFKSKLRELMGTDQKSLQFVMKKVKCKTSYCTCVFGAAFCWYFAINKSLLSSRFTL